MTEMLIRTDAIRIGHHRQSYGSCLALANDMRENGQRRPLTLWRDNTLISGERRYFAHLLMETARIQVVHVSTIEEAAKHIMCDNQDPYLALQPKWSEVIRLWQTLRRLDGPAAVKRADANRRRGIELRRQTQDGKRKPGRSSSRTEDYVLRILAEPYGASSATATRAELIWRTANGLVEADEAKQDLARSIMAEIDEGKSVWAGWQRLRGEVPPRVVRPRPAAVTDPAPAAQQRAAWSRALPQLDGLLAGLIELGPPHPSLGWEEVGPVRTRLMAARREIEKMINNMKESESS